MEKETEYLANLIKPLVTLPGEVDIIHSVDDKGVLLTVRVNKEDMGRLIGKDGANANAVRTLVRQLGYTSDKRISVKIEEPEGSTKKE